MDRVFSVEGIADQFWTSPPPYQLDCNNSNHVSNSASASAKMNRSSSEWALQQFIRENTVSDHSHAGKVEEDEVVEIRDHRAGPANVVVDSDEYQAFLKSRLDLACAAVAMSRTSFGKPQDSSTSTDCGSKVSDSSQVKSRVNKKGPGSNSSKRKYKEGPTGNPSLPAKCSKPMVQVKSSTSNSSRELSDDYELEGGTEITENMDHTDDKRVRRMMSNRESARRSRSRKQAHLTGLEAQVAQLKVENSSLLNRLAHISQKFNEAVVDNGVLKADVETLRAKLKMAEITVKRETGQSPMQSYDGNTSDISADAAVPLQDELSLQIHPQRTSNPLAATNSIDPRASNSLSNNSSTENPYQCSSSAETITSSGNKIREKLPMRRVASLEHLQKRIRGT